MADDAKRYTLIAADGEPHSSPQKGTTGGHRGLPTDDPSAPSAP
jgi:hypothetical protein